MAPWNVRVKAEAEGWEPTDEQSFYPCRSCGNQATELHHAIPKAIGNKETKRDLRNGLPLCNGCHGRYTRGAVIRREVFTEEEWEYLCSVTLTSMETQWYLDKHYPPAKVIVQNMLDHA